jgi:hypothetical protein
LLAAVAPEHSHGAPFAGIKHLPNQRRLLAARTTRPGRIGFEAGKDFVFELVAHESDAQRLSHSQVKSGRIVPYQRNANEHDSVATGPVDLNVRCRILDA